jgi:hypothetical protein
MVRRMPTTHSEHQKNFLISLFFNFLLLFISSFIGYNVFLKNNPLKFV